MYIINGCLNFDVSLFIENQGHYPTNALLNAKEIFTYFLQSILNSFHITSLRSYKN